MYGVVYSQLSQRFLAHYGTCIQNKLNSIAEYVLESLTYQWEKQHVINDLIIDLSAPKHRKKSYKLICTVMYFNHLEIKGLEKPYSELIC